MQNGHKLEMLISTTDPFYIKENFYFTQDITQNVDTARYME